MLARMTRALTLLALVAPLSAQSDLRPLLERFAADQGALERRYDAAASPVRIERFRTFYRERFDELESLDFGALDIHGKVDWLLFRNELRRRLRVLERQQRRVAEIDELLPFRTAIVELHEARRRHEWTAPRAAAEIVVEMTARLDETRERLEQEAPWAERGHLALRAARQTDALADTLADWYEFSAGYDPLFSWWIEQPYEAGAAALADYAAFLRTDLAGLDDPDAAIVGDPIGREALLEDLEHEMIPYSPEELIRIAKSEFQWCDREMLRASRELGFGEDWKAALEHVKALHVEPGRQPELVRELAYEAIEFVEEFGLVTIPPLAKETWRMSMMSPERQKVNPFFLGGEQIIVSFPTDTMSHADKLQSMRGNNPHFSRATVHHELIPGHHLQQFMTQRYRPYRRVFSTPFWTEGWSLWWEMLLWERGLPKTSEDRVGFLFWRMHRCARIIFSLSFHLGEMSAEEAIDFLVDRVGHERANAEAEVRRSFEGEYSPLYQAAYMLGALQFRALHRELADGGSMTTRDFHDAVLRLGRIPVEMVRATLKGEELDREFRPAWRFYGDGQNLHNVP